jgi:hypothetical protein
MFKTFFQKILPFLANVEEYGTARRATDENTALHRKHALCMPDN